MRPHHPWFRAAANAWYVEVGNQQQFLGKHPDGVPKPRKRKRGDPPPHPPKDIEAAYYRLMASGADKLPENPAVATVCDLFLDFSQKHHAPDTYRGYRSFLQDFCEMYGSLAGRDLRPLHVTRWLDAHPGWKGSRRNAVVAVKRAFNWADAEGLLQPNSVRTVRKPPQGKRIRVLTPEERQQLLAAIPDPHFREFVFAMLETGARPGEVRKVTAAHVDFDLGIWTLAEHKTARKTGKPRVIYLTPAMLEISRRLTQQYPEGPLFRGPRSQGGFSRNSIRIRFRNLRAKHPQLKGVISYTMRHSFATQALVNGVGLAHVAELLGHVDARMVSAHYSHLASNVEHMRDAARRAAVA
jgi:integrase